MDMNPEVGMIFFCSLLFSHQIGTNRQSNFVGIFLIKKTFFYLAAIVKQFIVLHL
jgi:hypothetical protein